MYYRKKPVVVEAIKWIGSNSIEIDTFITDHHETYPADGIVRLYTLEGVMTAQIGDYIIKGVQGEFYPCKPDIFEQTYEKVDKKIDKYDIEKEIKKINRKILVPIDKAKGYRVEVDSMKYFSGTEAILGGSNNTITSGVIRGSELSAKDKNETYLDEIREENKRLSEICKTLNDEVIKRVGLREREEEPNVFQKMKDAIEEGKAGNNVINFKRHSPFNKE